MWNQWRKGLANFYHPIQFLEPLLVELRRALPSGRWRLLLRRLRVRVRLRLRGRLLHRIGVTRWRVGLGRCCRRCGRHSGWGRGRRAFSSGAVGAHEGVCHIHAKLACHSGTFPRPFFVHLKKKRRRRGSFRHMQPNLTALWCSFQTCISHPSFHPASLPLA